MRADNSEFKDEGPDEWRCSSHDTEMRCKDGVDGGRNSRVGGIGRVEVQGKVRDSESREYHNSVLIVSTTSLRRRMSARGERGHVHDARGEEQYDFDTR